MISFLEVNTFVCERYGHLNSIHYNSKFALFLSRILLPAARRDNDYCALAAGANMIVLAPHDSQRPLNETTGLLTADLVQFALL